MWAFSFISTERIEGKRMMCQKLIHEYQLHEVLYRSLSAKSKAHTIATHVKYN